MNIPKAYIGGFHKAAKSPRMLFILYFANIITALIVALPFMGFLNESFGSSKIAEGLLDGFDFTAFSNLQFYSSEGLGAILSGVKWIFVAYLLLNIFLNGGIIRTLNKEKFTTSNFFAGSAYNFFRFLGLSAIVLVVQVLFALLIYVPLIMIFQSLGESNATEISYYYWGIGGVTLHLLVFLLISMIGDYGKFYLVLNDSFNILKGFWKGLRYSIGHFLKTYLLYLFLLIIPAVVMYVYLYYQKDFKMATGVGILIVFGIQQAFIFLRVFLRVWIFSSQFKMYASDFIKSAEMQDIVFSVVDTKETEEKVLEETEEEETKVTKKATSEGYAIDFNKTFAGDNEMPDDTQILTEEEMLKKVESEEETIKKEKDQLLTDMLEEQELEKKETERVEEETGETEAEGYNEDDEEEEDHLPELIHENVLEEGVEVEENVVLGETVDESTKKKEDKNIDNDIIEFEL